MDEYLVVAVDGDSITFHLFFETSNTIQRMGNQRFRYCKFQTSYLVEK